MTNEEIAEAMKLLRPMYQQPPRMLDDVIDQPVEPWNGPSWFDRPTTPVLPTQPQPAPFVAQPRMDMREINPMQSQPWRKDYRGGA